MYYTGFADEVSPDLDLQIKATKELGWENIESRNISGKNIHDISDEDFDVAYGKLQDAGVKINCFGSTICNWGKKIDEPMTTSVEETKRAIPRMKRLGTKLVRMMSFAVLPDREPDDQMEEERFKRVREICKMFTDEGLTPVHENCMNYGGMGWNYTLKLIENVPGLKLVFDTGNPVFTDDRSKAKPYPKQSAYKFYKLVRDHIAYIHIKDGMWDIENQKCIFTFPGEGHGDVIEIIQDLVDTGYDGGYSMEPHMASVFHDDSIKSKADYAFENYVEYGRRFMKIVDDCKAKSAK